MLMLATRPMKDYNITFPEDLKKIGSYEEIQLKGLGEAEIGEIILQNFDTGVNRISPEIVKVIQVYNISLFRLKVAYVESFF